MKTLILMIIFFQANIHAYAADRCNTPTIDFVRELAEYKNLPWAWKDQYACVIVGPGRSQKIVACLYVTDAERSEADECD